MKFYSNSNTDRQTIVHDVLYQVGLPTVSASFASYSLHDITRNVNSEYMGLVPLIWQSSFGWRYDDSNETDLPIATTTLSASVYDYTLPSTAQRIHQVKVRSGSEYIPIENIKEEDFVGGSGTPTGYCMVGNSILLDPIPSAALSAGLQLFVDRTPTLFTTNGTSASTTSPGFSEPFHKILSYAAAIDFVQDKATQDRLVAMKERLKASLINFYSHRNIERRPSLRPVKNWRRYK